MKREIGIGIAALLLALIACGQDPESKPASPAREFKPSSSSAEPERLDPTPVKRRLNVLLITLDTTRADALGAYGQALESSPNIDRLAREGVLFERAMTSNPETLPSHSTLFTGRYPFSHGVRSNSGFVLSNDNTTLAEVLAREGYRTAAEVAAMVMNEKTQVGQGFSQYRTPESPKVELKKVRYGSATSPEVEVQTRTGADITRRGIEFIRSNRANEFFLWLHYFDPHVPYSAPAAFNAKIPSSAYHAEIASADAQIGKLIKELEQLGLREQTLVILTSDHGEGLGEHEEMTHSYFVYQTTMHVPLIFWGPSQLAAATRVASTVRTIDVAPTVFDLLKIDGPSEMQGESLLSLLEGSTVDDGRVAYGESIEMSKVFDASALRILIDGRWKYIHKIEPELYDLEADPRELINLASEQREVVDRLRDQLERLVADAAPGPQDATAPVDAETRARLEALGYVAEPASEALRKSIESLELSGVDPSQKIEDVRRIGMVSAHTSRKRFDAALETLEILRDNNPTSAHIHSLLSKVLMDLDRRADAIVPLRRAVELDPSHLDYRQTLATLVAEQGDLQVAIDVLLPVFDLGQCEDTVWSALNEWLLAEKRYADRVSTLARAKAQCPDSAQTLNNYAWALATSPDAEVRNGSLAIDVALEAARKHGIPDPAYLDTLAAAHAEAGNFEEAVRVESQAVALLVSGGYPEQVIAAFRHSLAEMKAGRALRDPAR